MFVLGAGKIVKVDESLIGRRKYNRGRMVKGKWNLGGIVRGSKECFLVECNNNPRDHHVLISIIKQHVRPRTLIITDGWKGYLPITKHGYLHEDVNQSQNFVSPSTRAHTTRMLVPCEEASPTRS